MGNSRPAETGTSIGQVHKQRGSSRRDTCQLATAVLGIHPANKLEFFPPKAHKKTRAIVLSRPFPPLIDATAFDADLLTMRQALDTINEESFTVLKYRHVEPTHT